MAEATTVHETYFEDTPLGGLERSFWELLESAESEHLKTATELALDGLSRSHAGTRLLQVLSGSNEIRDAALHVSVAGIDFENPVVVGAGWDKKGRSVAGLHALGFSGVEVGTVPLFGQVGGARPRMWTSGDFMGTVGLNRLGFNSPGSEVVEGHLARHQDLDIPIGVNVGINKLTPHNLAPEMHALVTERLEPYAAWITFNPSSPNTPGLRELQRREPMRDNLVAIQEKANGKPVFVKIAPDIELGEKLDDIVEVSLENGVAGIICANTTSNQVIKSVHGWAEQAGGFSGDDEDYRAMVDSVMNYLVSAVSERGEGELEIIRVGGINTAQHVIKAMQAGASMVQVVTGIRQNKWKTATGINAGLLRWMQQNQVRNIQEIVGSSLG